MPLNGPAFGRVIGRVRRYIAGQAPMTLVPVDEPGIPVHGASVEAVHEKTVHRLAVVDGVLVNESIMKCWTADRLTLTERYAFDGWSWQVALVELDRAAGTDWPHYVELVGQARGAKQVAS